jgi:nucleotide-binding universal stress UspA family protein
MFNRILVPLDGSKLAERSIPHAEAFARIFGSCIILLQVLETASYHENPNSVDPLGWQIHKAEAEIYLKEVAARIHEDLNDNPQEGGIETKARVEYFIREGKTAENIVDLAHTENIDLIVISTHGSGGLSRWNISSVIHKVINLLYLPVLIVRAFNQPTPDETWVHYRRILLPIDSSRRAEYSLPVGIALAHGEMSKGGAAEAGNLAPQTLTSGAVSTNTKLLLAAIITPPEIPIPEPYPVEIGQLSEQLMHISREAVETYLNQMKERFPVECETCVIESASVPSTLHELANQDDIDLVLLCAHGYTGQFTWPYGSITRNYIEHGTKHVLVIQDIHRSQVRHTAAEIAAEESGRR